VAAKKKKKQKTVLKQQETGTGKSTGVSCYP
jgi:hypothetical protein